MSITKYTFDDTIHVVNLGDIHRGDHRCDYDSFYKTVDYIREHDNVYWLSTGDMLNVALQNSKSDVYSSQNVQNELKSLEMELEDISDKCLGLVSSNHHKRFERAVGMDLDDLVSKRLGIPYLGKVGLINITCGRCSYFVGLHHGVGGGRTEGAKANGAKRLDEVLPGCDCYMLGHTHAFRHFVLTHNYIDRKRNNLVGILSHYVVTGHYLQWEGSYAQDAMLPPRPIGSSETTFYAGSTGNLTRKRIEARFLG